MFDSLTQEDEDLICQPQPKKIKQTKPNESEPIHSSLCYNSFKAPPLVEYKSIDGYCETKPGKSPLIFSETAINSPSISGVNNVQSISSPITFKSPKTPALKTASSISQSKPFVFFSVEELSLVKCLKHWANTKVCAVGHVMSDLGDQHCYLRSVMEKGHWKILLDMSLVREIPNFELFQIFGTLEIIEGLSRIKVNFYRSLGSVDLPLFIESYKLMHKYVPEFIEPIKNENVTELDDPDLSVTASEDDPDLSVTASEDDPDLSVTASEVKLNDTLDVYSFSNIM